MSCSHRSSRRRSTATVPAGFTMAGAFLANHRPRALLTLGDGLAFHRGDVLTLVCAVAFAIHIVILSRLAPRHRVVPFTAVQLAYDGGAGPCRLGPHSKDSRCRIVRSSERSHPHRDRRERRGVPHPGRSHSGSSGPVRPPWCLSLEPLFAATTAAIVLGERLTRLAAGSEHC